MNSTYYGKGEPPMGHPSEPFYRRNRDAFELDEKKYTIIPDDVEPTKIYSITLDGWDYATETSDPAFACVTGMLCGSLQIFVGLYKDTHAFTQPQLSYILGGIKGYVLQIGTLEIEKYQAIKKGAK